MGRSNGAVWMVVVVLAATMLAGCAQQGDENVDDKNEVEELQSKVDALQSEVDSLKQDNSDLRDRVDTLEDQLGPETGLDVVVEQDPGGTVYWVLPGERRLSPQVFGTADDRRTTGAWSRQAAQDLADQGKAPPSVPGLLEDLPILTGVPEDDPDWPVEDRDGQLVLTRPTLFSDKAAIVNGSFRVAYKDRQPWDGGGPPGETMDESELRATFTDPAGNQYEVTLDHLVKPPIPGYETGGGVITNAWHHGHDGPGSPLMPSVYTYGANWALGNISVNGEQVDAMKLVHVMTTQTVRTADYELAIDEELPLPPDDTPAGQAHHTHLVVFPIGVLGDGPPGPKHQPVNTSFVLQNGKKQPFIHVMFEEDRVVEGPFTDEDDGGDGDGDVPAGADFLVEGDEWVLTPSEINLTQAAIAPGDEVEVAFKNVGNQAHNWGVDLDGDGETTDDVRTSTIQPGKVETVTFKAPGSGTYGVWCDVGGGAHRDAGMEASLVVAAS